jgi:bacitracin synthase 3
MLMILKKGKDGMCSLYEDIKYLHNIFEHWASKSPNAIAVSHEAKQLTYSELNVRTNQIANYLIMEAGVQPGNLIGLCLGRNLDLIASLLAILKIGAVYVPLDIANPPIRISNILNDVNPKLTIVDEQTKNKISFANVLNLSEEKKKIHQQRTGNPSVDKKNIDLCYIIHTSGTTGKPNGVCVSHGNVINLLKAADSVYAFTANDIWTLFHSHAFDFSVWEIWGALAFGGKLVIVPYDTCRIPKEFYRLLIKEKVTILNQTPAAFYQLIDVIINSSQFKQLGLKKVIFGAHALDIHYLRPWFEKFGDKKIKLYNMYGITETTVHATYHRITSNDLTYDKPIIGRALPFYKVHLLNANSQSVPVGQKGEIYITGSSVSKGYLNNAKLTKARFKPLNSKNKYDTKIMYKSGDLGVYLPNGNLVYLGRIDDDFQVKIRGYRIELDEIKSLLNQQREVKLAIVLAKGESVEQQCILAFVQINEQYLISPKELRARLKILLPDYMLPKQIYFLAKMPLTLNNKIDTKALLDGKFKPKKERRET